MASTYVNDLRLEEMATGDQSGSWGTTTNTNLELIAEAFSYGTEAITTNADTHTTTIADGSTDPGRSIYLKYTGTLDSACTITIGPNTVSKLWFIENGTSGSQNIIISQGSGANITIPAGDVKVVYSDGAGSGAAVVDAFASLSVVDLKVQDDLTVTDDVSIGGALTLTGNGDFNGDLDVDGTTNLDVVDIDGAVDMASTLGVTGVVTANAGVVVDNITIDGTEIDLSSGDLTLDVAGDIILDAAGQQIFFTSAGTNVGQIDMAGTDLELKSLVSNADLFIRGNDDGSEITALTFDMSDAGTAQFNKEIDLLQSNHLRWKHAAGGTIRASIDADSNDNLMFYTGSSETERMRIDSAGKVGIGGTPSVAHVDIANTNSDKFLHLDDGTNVALTFQKNGTTSFVIQAQGTGFSSWKPLELKANYFELKPNNTLAASITGTTADFTHAQAAHTNGIKIINSQAGGYGSALTFQSERSDDNSIVTAARIRTEGADSWNSDSTTESSIVYETCNNNSLSEKMRMTNTGRLGIGTTAPVELLHVYSGASAACRVSGGANANRKIEIGYDNSDGPVIRGGSSGETGIKFYVDNTTLAGKFDTNADFYTNDGTVHSLSDSRVKTDINDLIDGLDIVKQLQPKTFKYNEKSEFYNEETKDEVKYGFVADEVQEVAPQYMQVGKGKIDGVKVDDLKTLSTTKMIPMLVKAIQEQQEQIDALQSEINILKGE